MINVPRLYGIVWIFRKIHSEVFKSKGVLCSAHFQTLQKKKAVYKGVWRGKQKEKKTNVIKC